MRGRVVAIGLGGAAAVVAVTWAVGAFLGFNGFAAAWTVHFAMMAWMSALLDAAKPELRGDWFRVRAWEPGAYRRLGAWRYMRLLRAIGWERHNRRLDGARSSLPAFELATRRSEAAHLVIGLIGLVLAAVAIGFRAWWAAGWLVFLDVVLHGYPVLLQRAVRFRLQRLAPAHT
ncbi:hypothetical protein OHA21_26010 [Actinoplanes sp. NBC_00393]|uniref:glycosyl-4,4'-diaponeurosporenoate acyltransferase CrtO family protein n=1 Tax=Actinoplanes sp. NBC_00393 TaxID=2975953 RepID=UPI002E21DD08